MSGVEWLYFPLSLLILEFLLFKVIDFLRVFFTKLAKLDEELSQSKKAKSKVEKADTKETKETETKKEVVTKDVEKEVAVESAKASSANAYSKVPYVESNAVYGNYLCDFFNYDSNYVLTQDQYHCKQCEIIKKKRYSIMDEMDADNIDDKAYAKLSDIMRENNARSSILDEFNGLSKEMKLFLINSMLK